MSVPLRVLLVEDSEDDAELLLNQLRRSGYEPSSARVDTEEAMRDALGSGRWDVILSDHSMPRFSAPAALNLLRESHLDVPFLIVSGTIGEERAVAALKAGAADYVSKENLSRLGPVVSRELRDAESRRAFHEAQVLATRLSRILDDTSEAILVFEAESLRFVQVNRGAREKLGYEPDELLRLTVLDVAPELSRERFAALAAVLFARAQDHVVIDTFFRRKDGETYPVELRLHASHGEHPPVLVGIAVDVTARRRAEAERAALLERERQSRAEAEEQRRRWEFLASASTQLAASLDYRSTLSRVARLSVPELADWCVVFVLEGETALRPVDAVHANLAQGDLLDGLCREGPVPLSQCPGLEEAIRDGNARVVQDAGDGWLTRAFTRPDYVRVFREAGLGSCMVVPLSARGRALGVLLFASEVPRDRYDRAELTLARDLARRAAAAADNARLYRDAQEAVRAREEFLSIASHELKTPITSLFMAVQGVLRLMRKGALAGGTGNPAYARLQTIERQSLRLARLVDDLLDVSRINSGQLQLELGEHDLVAVVQDAVARFSTDASNPKVLLDVRARPPLLGHWDRVRVEQVVTNLLSNAAKYGRGKPIDVVVEATAAMATVCVRDQGIGISQEDVSRIFERFERAPSARGSVMGLGLGLYIVRKILDLHGGAIRVQSSVGVGSTFVIELPRSGPARPLRTEEPPTSDLPPRQEH